MRLNENTKIVGDKVLLIPYEAKHVLKYNDWMHDDELLELTGSEPLSLEDEYAMQKSWRDDDDKCTFLIVSRPLYENTGDEIAALIGDTNFFLRLSDDEPKKKIAEAEIMIAEKGWRGKGCGKEAMLLMFKYGQSVLNIEKFEVKIKMQNNTSIQMFEKMFFRKVNESTVFQEVTMEVDVTESWIKWLDEQVTLQTDAYDNE